MLIVSKAMAPRTYEAIMQVKRKYLTVQRINAILAQENQAERRHTVERQAKQMQNRVHLNTAFDNLRPNESLNQALRRRAAQKSRDKDDRRER
jgi:hypothetical protein